jgi:hypothetical protein
VGPFVERRYAKIDQNERGRLEGTVNLTNNCKLRNYLYSNTRWNNHEISGLSRKPKFHTRAHNAPSRVNGSRFTPVIIPKKECRSKALVTIRNILLLCGKFWPTSQPKLRSTLCRLSAAIYSIQPLSLSIPEGFPLKCKQNALHVVTKQGPLITEPKPKRY